MRIKARQFLAIQPNDKFNLASISKVVIGMLAATHKVSTHSRSGWGRKTSDFFL
ncbi:hypothetical protein [Methylibium rhizosphaerae]|uniref:hypothetical protein n=1 Tax=Methylibium rhizosphaerae TaxID=2570323 RepID=UPI0015E3F246|nr:hypothetical protein [Methylibium rhizosphaerae]